MNIIIDFHWIPLDAYNKDNQCYLSLSACHLWEYIFYVFLINNLRANSIHVPR